MCGIFGYVGENVNAGEITLTGLKKLEYRGYDSWGVAISNKDKILLEKHLGKIIQTSLHLPKSNIAIGHTRWATHGGVLKKNTHPFVDCQKRIALLHNGIIENYQELKKVLKQKGHKFSSDTDSEIAVHLIEEELKKENIREAVRKAFKKLQGLNAMVIMDGKTKKVIAIKNGSPLIIGIGSNENFISSDAHALLENTREVIFINDGEMVELEDKKCIVLNTKTGFEKKKRIQHLDWENAQIKLEKYPYFMLKEIHEQPRVIDHISYNLKNEIGNLSKRINNSDETYFVGCGSAFHACLSAQYLLSELAHKRSIGVIGSELSLFEHFLDSKSLLIALSQSGETADIIEGVKKSIQKKCRIVGICNTYGSTLYRMSNDNILINAGPEKAVASTKAFIGKLSILILLAYDLIGKFDNGRKILTSTKKDIERIISNKYCKIISSISQKIHTANHIFVIGRGTSFPIALEAALKIKEISYIHAEGFAAGELKHGVIALIEKNTPCIVLAPNDKTYKSTLSCAMEIKARGGFIIGISHIKNDIFDEYIYVEDNKEGSLIGMSIVTQLLAYYLAVLRKLDPDKPRNLAKSVTVK